MRDPIHALVHDHGDLNRRVLELRPLVRDADPDGVRALLTLLRELREQLFLHFAREEEGLFPFVEETLPDLAEQIEHMVTAHDAICGALARMFHLASSGGAPAAIRALCERFEEAYAAHARTEGELLRDLDAHLDPDHRSKLAEIVRGL